MISQEETAFQPGSRESRSSPPKQRASGQAAATASGGLIYDPTSGSLRYPKFSQLPGGSKSEKSGGNVTFPIQASNGPSSGKSSSIAGEKHSRLLNAHGGPYEQPSADSSPRCVISNSTLESSNSTSPSGSKSVSEMDDYSDVKQLITHNRSSSPSDVEDDGFYDHKGLKSSGFRQLEASRGGTLDNPPRQKNSKGTGELAQKIFQVASSHTRSISTSGVPGIDTFQKFVVKDHSGQHHQKLETPEVHLVHSSNGSNLGALPHNPSLTVGALLDANGGQGLGKTKSKGVGGSFRGSQSQELLSMSENGWGVGEHDGVKTMQPLSAIKNSPLDPVLESLMKASFAKEGSIFKQQQNQIAEKIEEMKRKNGVKSSVQNNAFSHGGAGAFSFNQTHVVRVNDADLLDYDSNYDTISNSSFDFCRGGDTKGVHRTVLNNFTKPAPSKWDDAEKWLSCETPSKTKAKSGSQGHPLAQGALALSKKAAFLNQAGRLIPNISQLAKPLTVSISTPVNSGSDASSSAGDVGVVSNDGDEGFTMPEQQRSKGERTKKMDSSAKFVADINNQEEAGDGGAAVRFAFVPPMAATTGKQSRTTPASSFDRYPLEDLYGRDNGDAKDGCTSPDAPLLELLDPALRTEKPTSDCPSREESSKLESASTEQLSSSSDAAPKVCMRDMGTAMTPVPSVEPSRTATPVCARTPSVRSPSSSRPATPSRVVPTSSPTCETERKIHYTDKELQSKTRQEILALGTQLGKHNIAAWATKEEEEEDAFKSLKSNVDLEEVRKVVIATRATAWEEAEQAKYLARYKREEAKIQAWENHERSKAEADMRSIEMKIERMRSRANENLMNKLAATRRSAEELRAAAAARRGEQSSKTSERAEYIRKTGKLPGSIFASLCCS